MWAAPVQPGGSGTPHASPAPQHTHNSTHRRIVNTSALCEPKRNLTASTPTHPPCRRGRGCPRTTSCAPGLRRRGGSCGGSCRAQCATGCGWAPCRAAELGAGQQGQKHKGKRLRGREWVQQWWLCGWVTRDRRIAWYGWGGAASGCRSSRSSMGRWLPSAAFLLGQLCAAAPVCLQGQLPPSAAAAPAAPLAADSPVLLIAPAAAESCLCRNRGNRHRQQQQQTDGRCVLHAGSCAVQALEVRLLLSLSIVCAHQNLTAPWRGLDTERLRRKRSYLAFCLTMPPLMLISSHRTHTCSTAKPGQAGGGRKEQGEAAARGGQPEGDMRLLPGAANRRPLFFDNQQCRIVFQLRLPLLLPVRLLAAAQRAGRPADASRRLPPPAGLHPSRHRASTLLHHSPRAGR